MKKQFQILAYLITRLAIRANPRIKIQYLGDSIGFGFVLINSWVSICISELIIETVYPKFSDQFTFGRIPFPIVLIYLLLMIIEYFIFFSKDQWREFIPKMEQMDRETRRKLSWRVIGFLSIAIPLSIILLVIKNPILVTWTE